MFASEVSQRVTNMGVQVHGGYGYVEEYKVERFLRDAKLTELGEGTSQIQRLVIGRRMLGIASRVKEAPMAVARNTEISATSTRASMTPFARDLRARPRRCATSRARGSRSRKSALDGDQIAEYKVIMIVTFILE